VSGFRGQRWLAVAALGLLSGCAGNIGSMVAGLDERRELVELQDVPFHSQVTDQCGPAALATVLNDAGIAVTTIHPGFVATPLTEDNRYPMPFLMSAERAARIVADGLERRPSEINFPWQMSLLIRVARRVPNWLWDRAMTWLLRPRRRRARNPEEVTT